MDHTVKYTVKQVRLYQDDPSSERFTHEGRGVAYWLEWFKPGGFDPCLPFSEVHNPHLRGVGWELAIAQISAFVLLHSDKTTLFSTSLPLSGFPSKTDVRKMGGQNVGGGWAGEQVLFLWLSASREEEVKTFSPLITRETTWRLELNSVCVCMKSLARRSFLLFTAVAFFNSQMCVSVCMCG